MSTLYSSGLRSRLLLLIIIAVIPALGYILFTAAGQRSQKEVEIGAETMRMAKLAANNLEQLVEVSRQVLAGLSELPGVRYHDTAVCNVYFTAFKEHLPMYNNIATLKPNGDVTCSASPVQNRTINLSDRLHFKMAVRKKILSFGDYTIGRIIPTPMIGVALPVLDNQQQIKTVVIASIDLDWFKEQLTKVKIPEQASLTVLDRKWNILYRYPETEKWTGKDMSNSEVTKAIGAQEEGVVVAKGVDGITRIWAFIPVRGTDKGLYVRYGISREAAFADINRLLKKNLLVLLIITCMALTVAWYGGNYFFMRRMRILTKATDDLANGNLSVRVDMENQQDELSQLGSSFNRMAEALEHHIEERKQSEEQYRTLFEESKDAISVTTPEGRYLDINPALVELYGYASKEEMLTLDINTDIFVDPEGRKVFAQVLKEKGFVKDYEQHLKRKDGKRLTLLTTTTTVRNKNGDIIAFRNIKHDITERKQAEEALRERNVFINTILEASPVAIYSMDKEGVILTWNKGAELMFGWSKGDVVGKINPIVPEGESESFQAHRKKIQNGERLLGVELRRRKKDGSSIDISLSAAPIYDTSGAVTGQISVVMDITQQKKMEAERAALENQLRQAQKMEAVGQLAGGVAHDFNNILSAIIGYSHLALMKIGDNDPNRHNIQQIMASSERAAVLTQSLLAFSRKQTVNLTRIDLNDVIAKFEKFLLRLLREDIEFKTALVNLELPVMADRGQVEQVLMNLVANSRDAMPKGGRILIETGQVELDKSFIEAHGVGQAGNYACLSVTDTGIGMSEDVKNKIFDPFFTTKEAGKGTGLGLSMVYGIVQKHQGCVDVHSQLGIGTTFKIYLPLSRISAETGEQKTDEQTPPRGGKETILLAEDDVSLRSLSATVLRQYGYTVIEAVDGLDAVSKFEQDRNSISLVILDGIMPKKNGKEAWKEIKAISSGVKAIFVSGYAEDIFTKDGVPDTEAVFIHKPSPPLVLVRKIREILDE
jgi:PAS domain S-box-containing protein